MNESERESTGRNTHWFPGVARLRRVLSRVRGCPPHDRYLLEEIIFGQLRSRADVRRILFVGCAPYTKHYPARFADREFITIDIDPAQAQYGSAVHIVDTLANLSAHISPDSLDVVICNGVFGWGLDDRDQIEVAVEQCFRCLRPGGLFVVGWNDTDPWRPVAFDEIESFGQFEETVFPPFPAPTYPTLGELRHVFSFFARPA